jgi:hypothetical protein
VILRASPSRHPSWRCHSYRRQTMGSRLAARLAG